MHGTYKHEDDNPYFTHKKLAGNYSGYDRIIRNRLKSLERIL